MTFTEFFRMGFDARKLGMSVEDCPSIIALDRLAWIEGWETAERMLEK